jgi:predicted porin
VTRLTDGGVYASRLGFRGTEDLGGGNFASFNLEAGINADNGTGTLPGPGLAFTRLSKLGLGGRWGVLEAGRMFTPLFNSVSRGDPFGFNTVYSPLSLLGQADGQTGIVGYASRANNMIYYRTPNHFPVMAHVAYSLGEAGSAGNRSGDLYGGSLGYNTASLFVSYAFQKARGGSGAAPQPNPRVSTYHAISASYAPTSNVRLYGDLIRSDAGDSAIGDSRVVVIGAAWTSGASEFRAAASRRSVEGSSRGQTLWVLGYDYSLSKRTALYTRALHLQNRGGSTAAAAGLPITATGGDGTSLGVGIRHNF